MSEPVHLLYKDSGSQTRCQLFLELLKKMFEEAKYNLCVGREFFGLHAFEHNQAGASFNVSVTNLLFDIVI